MSLCTRARRPTSRPLPTRCPLPSAPPLVATCRPRFVAHASRTTHRSYEKSANATIVTLSDIESDDEDDDGEDGGWEAGEGDGGWEEARTEDGSVYWWHTSTNETTWECPFASADNGAS